MADFAKITGRSDSYPDRYFENDAAPMEQMYARKLRRGTLRGTQGVGGQNVVINSDDETITVGAITINGKDQTITFGDTITIDGVNQKFQFKENGSVVLEIIGSPPRFILYDPSDDNNARQLIGKSPDDTYVSAISKETFDILEVLNE